MDGGYGIEMCVGVDGVYAAVDVEYVDNGDDDNGVYVVVDAGGEDG